MCCEIAAAADSGFDLFVESTRDEFGSEISRDADDTTRTSPRFRPREEIGSEGTSYS